jgi:hypothetical protein
MKLVFNTQHMHVTLHTESLNICRIWMNTSLTNFLFTAESVLHLNVNKIIMR